MSTTLSGETGTMIDVPIYDMTGKQTGSMQINESLLGGRVRLDLLKQAVTAWRANQRQGSARTKSRGMVTGSTRKLYRQKGTGNARAGAARTPVRRGGGVTFAKTERPPRLDMPKKMRRLARNSALLAKLQSSDVLIVESLQLDQPKTKTFFKLLKALGAERGCVVALGAPNDIAYKSGRNIPKTEIRQVHELNAYEILRRRKVIFSKDAFETLVANPGRYRRKAAAGQ